VDPNRIEFSVRFFRFATSLNLLTFVCSGSIWIERAPKQLRYQLKFGRELVTLSTLIPMVFGIPLHRARNLSRLDSLAILLTIWLWLFGMNYGLSVFRFRRWLAKLTVGR
jgi:hypothetical protein